MNWYMQSGKDSDVVISTKIRYARNLRNYRFDGRDFKKVEEEVKSKITNLGYDLNLLEIKDMDELTRKCLLEKRLISKKCLKNDESSILINDDENICIMLNEEEHIKLQVFNGGFGIDSIFNLAKEIDKKIEETFDIAKNKKYGYLTNTLTDVGTGMKIQVIVHLPGLAKTENIKRVLESISSFGVNIQPLNGNKKSDLFKIENKQTLGISEETIVKNIKIITDKIIEQERVARRMLAKNQLLLEDMLYRSFGILANCKKISEEETLQLLSDVKLGVDLGLIKEVNDSMILQIYLYSKPANLQKKIGQNLDKFDRDIKRAEMIKEIIQNKK